ncbi:DUF5329 domain-containing protein [Methylibium rhizosphaerae]|uniref:DUF5329 domain-containing protein n=1 Tax=Methylibium rhizosphaerae TaxID=2570323 RepID=UPI001128912E|nr:DUF5329 domain-containing protein [Methylibium rhizosphaerae]
MARRLIQSLALLALVCGTGLAAAQQATPPTAAREISALLGHIERSGCSFERNGQWHEAPAARAHIERKYRALAERGLVPSAESFIELAATRSSTTGRPYQVRCGQAPAVASGPWLMQALGRLRE